MKIELVWLFNALENIALSLCITYAAVSFNRWQLMWFYIIVLLNRVSYQQKKENEENKTDE